MARDALSSPPMCESLHWNKDCIWTRIFRTSRVMPMVSTSRASAIRDQPGARFQTTVEVTVNPGQRVKWRWGCYSDDSDGLVSCGKQLPYLSISIHTQDLQLGWLLAVLGCAWLCPGLEMGSCGPPVYWWVPMDIAPKCESSWRNGMESREDMRWRRSACRAGRAPGIVDFGTGRSVSFCLLGNQRNQRWDVKWITRQMKTVMPVSDGAFETAIVFTTGQSFSTNTRAWPVAINTWTCCLGYITFPTTSWPASESTMIAVSQ